MADYTIDHAHSEYLEAAVEWGVPAVVVLVAGMATALLRIFRALQRQQEQQRQIGLGCLAGALAIALHAAVDFPLRIPAILALFGVLLGMAAGAVPPVIAFSKRRSMAAGCMTAVWISLGVCSLCSIPASAEANYAEGRRLLVQGRTEEAAAAWRRTLEVNPYAAPAWRELAWIRESQGDARSALAFAELAQMLEPHTRRGEWAIANLYLRLGKTVKNHGPRMNANQRE